MKNVIVGAGPIGSRVASLLANQGEDVTLISRRGAGPEHPRIRRLALDATDRDALIVASRGADTLFQCAMPAYDRWLHEFPTLADSLLHAVKAHDLTYVMTGNLYAYGAVEGRFHERLPLRPSSRKGELRARLWEDALRTTRATEVRASDFLGCGVISMFTLLALPNLRSGKPIRVPAELDTAHSWSASDDVARTLIAARGGVGRAWHVPSHDLSWRELCARMASVLALPLPPLESMSDAELRALGQNDSLVHELVEMSYLQRRPCLIDSRESERLLGVQRGDLESTLRAMR